MLTTTYISALACEKIGFNIDAADMLSQNATVVGYALGGGVLVGATGLAVILGINYYYPELLEVTVLEENEMEENATALTPDRISQFQLSTPAKTEVAKQLVFDETKK